MQTRLKPRPDEPHLAVHPPSCITPLWGVWEMWCVLPGPVGAAAGGGGNNNVRSSAVKGGALPKANAKSATWLDQVRSIGLFDNAEGFWGIVSCTLPPSQLPPGITYYMLRRNIAPMWEHEANRRGGRWVVRFQQQQQQQESATRGRGASTEGKPAEAALQPLPVDAAWENLCIALIGERLPCPETEICGVALRRAERRRDWKLSLWTRTAADRETQMRIGRFVKTLLDLEDGALQYLSHRELMQASEEGSWSIPPRYEL
ncbi:eukaryotic translation initiation factor 4E (eIF4E) interacting protein [Trypanosoma grayi]|uniref:eukaryotic translation initiation factor 4E (eIF4E) interacting protein n=1 Tax=Trypanosoma grayi TaxID=71804 RepID=UPI0004F47793|nr:eukaryotic translation initiation factor 4E (eIF4E) interacting protein [Trypanosoma grayi]KEG13090.1 eukaryotic translation initiation factor 4E (eIF4E) interacting protein [Trypanosoma grayi]